MLMYFGLGVAIICAVFLNYVCVIYNLECGKDLKNMKEAKGRKVS